MLVNWSIPAPGSVAFVNSRREFLAWTDDLRHGIELRGGRHLDIPPHGLFDIDPSGQYFVIGEKPSSTWLGDISSPELRICISTNVLAQRVFARSNLIYVTGAMYKTNAADVGGIATCLTIERVNSTDRIVHRFQFPWAAGFIDIDPYAQRGLLDQKADMFPKLIVLRDFSGDRAAIGRFRGYAFFLTGDVLNTASKRE